MNWKNLLEIVGDESLFSTGLLLVGETRTAHVRRQLDRWVRSGKLLQLRRGLYALADPYRKVVASPFVIANRLRGASYVSLQSALAHHGMIPEHVPVTTSVSSGRPQVIDTALGRYSYRPIQQARFHGFEWVEVSDGQHAFVARPEKALLDLLYLTAALEQTGWQGPEVERDNWRGVVCDRIGQLDWARAAEDVAPFIERPEDLSLVTLDTCRRLLRAR